MLREVAAAEPVERSSGLLLCFSPVGPVRFVTVRRFAFFGDVLVATCGLGDETRTGAPFDKASSASVLLNTSSAQPVTTNNDDGDYNDDNSPRNTASHTVLPDGYHWRKYGHKIVSGHGMRA